MRGIVRLGRIVGIPIGLHWSALLGMLLITQLLALGALPALLPGHSQVSYWLVGAGGAVALLASLLVHELAHSIVARRNGVDVRQITLWLLGGVSELAGTPSSPESEVRIALVGPLTSLALGGLCLGADGLISAFGAPALASTALSWLGSLNVVLGVFNLLPGTPLDGGRVLHGLLWRRTGDPVRATRASSTAGQVLGALLAGYGIVLVLGGKLDGLWLMLVGWFLAGAASAEATSSSNTALLRGLCAGDVMSSPVSVAQDWLTVQAFIDHLIRDRPRYRAFPVTDYEGRLTGTVSTSALAHCPASERMTTTVRQLTRPLPRERVLDPRTPLDQLVGQPWAAKSWIAVVVSAGHIVGVLTGSDLARELERAALVDVSAEPNGRG